MTTASSSGGIGFVGVLTIVFIVLKLIEEITWSWVWVLSPIWISAAFSVFILVVIGIVAALVKRGNTKRRKRIAARRRTGRGSW